MHQCKDTQHTPLLHSRHGGLLQALRFDRFLQLPQLSQQRPLPQTQGFVLCLLLDAFLLAGQPAVGLLQPPQQGVHHVQAGGWDTVPGDGQPGPLQEQIQLRRLLFQTVDALPDQRQLGATVLQYLRVTAGGALDSRDVFIHSAQGHEEAVEGASGCFTLADLLTELIQAGLVSVDLPRQREAVSGVQIRRFGVQTGHLVQLALDVLIKFLLKNETKCYDAQNISVLSLLIQM